MTSRSPVGPPPWRSAANLSTAQRLAPLGAALLALAAALVVQALSPVLGAVAALAMLALVLALAVVWPLF
jgi:hypothetical protein